jgi:hypothetical protein
MPKKNVSPSTSKRGQSELVSTEVEGPNGSSQGSITQLILARTIEDQIRDRAYELYVQRGRKDGSELKDWLDAEFELLANR